MLFFSLYKLFYLDDRVVHIHIITIIVIAAIIIIIIIIITVIIASFRLFLMFLVCFNTSHDFRPGFDYIVG